MDANLSVTCVEIELVDDSEPFETDQPQHVAPVWQLFVLRDETDASHLAHGRQRALYLGVIRLIFHHPDDAVRSDGIANEIRVARFENVEGQNLSR
jgi:hypothetical protein